MDEKIGFILFTVAFKVSKLLFYLLHLHTLCVHTILVFKEKCVFAPNFTCNINIVNDFFIIL